jgi:nucleoside-diphosphate-sugar epimerase
VLDKDQLAQAMAGATVVIHCATGLSDVIIQGTRNALNVASDLEIRRFVHLSTTEVYGDAIGEIDEKAQFKYSGREYGDSKIEAEKLCWQHYEKGLPITVIRPPIVYGPFSKDWILRLAQRLQSGNWGVFDKYGEGICNLAYVTDIVSAILLAARHERAVGEAFNLSGPESITWNEYFERLNAALGLPELRVINPSGSKLRAAALQPVKLSARFILKHFEAPLKKLYERSRGARKAMQFAEKSIKTSASNDELNLYNRRAVYSSSKAQEMLGYRPRIGVDAGLGLSVAWLKHLGLVR